MSRDSFNKVYTADYSIEGYEGGINDARQRKPNSKFGLFRSLHPLSYLWGFNDALDSYSRNYDQGYLDGQRGNNQVYQPTTDTPAMNASDSYTNHLQMLDEVKRAINSLKPKLGAIQERYRRQIDAAEGAGFMREYTEQLRQRHARFAGKVDALIDCIERHNHQLEQQQTLIAQLRAQALRDG